MDLEPKRKMVREAKVSKGQNEVLIALCHLKAVLYAKLHRRWWPGLDTPESSLPTA